MNLVAALIFLILPSFIWATGSTQNDALKNKDQYTTQIKEEFMDPRIVSSTITKMAASAPESGATQEASTTGDAESGFFENVKSTLHNLWPFSHFRLFAEEKPKLIAGAAPQRIERSFEVKDIERLKLEARCNKGGGGNINIHATDSNQILLSMIKRSGDAGCLTEANVNGKELFIQAGFLWTISEMVQRGNEECRVDIDITIPKRLSLDLKIGASTLSIDGIEGDFNIEMVAGELRGTTRAQNVFIDATASDIDLEWREVRRGTTLQFSSAVSDATFRLPKNTGVKSIDVEGDSMSTVTDNVRFDRDGYFFAKGKVKTGNASFKYAK